MNNLSQFDLFSAELDELRSVLDRKIEQITVIPLHGEQSDFSRVEDAVTFIRSYDEARSRGEVFREYEVIVKYVNGDRIEATFKDKQKTLCFLKYVADV
jgi:hypothetical protein